MLLFAVAGDTYITRSCVATNHSTGCFPLDELYGQGLGFPGVKPVGSKDMGDMSVPDIDIPDTNVPGEMPWMGRHGRSMMFSGTGCLCNTDLCDPDTPKGWNMTSTNGDNGKDKGPKEIKHLHKAPSSASRHISVTHGFVVLALPVLCAAQWVRAAQFH